MNSPKPDSFDALLAGARSSPPPGDVDRVLPGLEARVIARLRNADRESGPLWFWRWSALFGATAIVCVVLLANALVNLEMDSVAGLDQGGWLLAFFL